MQHVVGFGGELDWLEKGKDVGGDKMAAVKDVWRTTHSKMSSWNGQASHRYSRLVVSLHRACILPLA